MSEKSCTFARKLTINNMFSRVGDEKPQLPQHIQVMQKGVRK